MAKLPWAGVNVVKKSLSVWLMIIPLAVLNGAIRDNLLQSLLGRYALPASGITMSVLVLLLAWVFVPRFGASEPWQLVWAGMVWAVLAVVFECVLGVVLGRSPGELLTAYDVTTGNLWLLVVICVGCAPWLAARLRGII